MQNPLKGRPFWQKLLAMMCCYVLLAGVFYWVVAEDWRIAAVSTEAVSPSDRPDFDEDGQLVIQQSFIASMDRLDGISLQPLFQQENPMGEITFALSEGDTLLWQASVSAQTLAGSAMNEIVIEPSVIGVKGKLLTLSITSCDGVTFWFGNTVIAGKFDVAVQSSGVLTANGVEMDGQLVMEQHGYDIINADRLIWPMAIVIGAGLTWLVIHVHRCSKKGKPSKVLTFFGLLDRYSYLLKQLVTRDFKVRYKGSVLGALWSFLNPLMTMTVYFFVFSTIFRNNIEHFPVYLMSGIVIFNYFSDSTTLGLFSIVGNAHLITKVYMPKYIYPFSKVLSSAINMIISLVPLLLVVIFSGVTLHKSLLLLPVVIVFLVVFCTGMSLLLSCMTVFFRDVQFLWSVIVTMWNFITPIFYPETIIPAQFMPLYRLNPLYQFISFMRSIIIDGISPDPMSYLACILCAGIPFVFGLSVFRKNQDKFVFHL